MFCSSQLWLGNIFSLFWNYDDDLCERRFLKETNLFLWCFFFFFEKHFRFCISFLFSLYSYYYKNLLGFLRGSNYVAAANKWHSQCSMRLIDLNILKGSRHWCPRRYSHLCKFLYKSKRPKNKNQILKRKPHRAERFILVGILATTNGSSSIIGI